MLSEARNFALLALQQVVVRVGWIFKTESVLIPAFLDSIAGPGWMRGLLPVLNRVGQSVPAFLLSGPLKATPLKKHVLALASFAMAVPFLALAAVSGGSGAWLPFSASICSSGASRVSISWCWAPCRRSSCESTDADASSLRPSSEE